MGSRLARADVLYGCTQTRAAGNALVLAPVLDLSRDPRYGRVEEMYSEDPYLSRKWELPR